MSNFNDASSSHLWKKVVNLEARSRRGPKLIKFVQTAAGSRVDVNFSEVWENSSSLQRVGPTMTRLVSRWIRIPFTFAAVTVFHSIATLEPHFQIIERVAY